MLFSHNTPATMRRREGGGRRRRRLDRRKRIIPARRKAIPIHGRSTYMHRDDGAQLPRPGIVGPLPLKATFCRSLIPFLRRRENAAGPLPLIVSLRSSSRPWCIARNGYLVEIFFFFSSREPVPPPCSLTGMRRMWIYVPHFGYR